MLERACGLADVLADYYRNNQQARRRPGLSMRTYASTAAMTLMQSTQRHIGLPDDTVSSPRRYRCGS